jgi:ankyrin repeat protein
MNEWYDVLPHLRNKQLVWWAQCNQLCHAIAKPYIQRAKWRKQGVCHYAKNGNLKAIQYLVQGCGADVHTSSDYALRWASRNGHLNVVRHLVENGGANVNAREDCELSPDDFTALEWASINGHLAVVKYLVEKGANVHVHDCFGMQSARKNGYLKVVRFLVERCGADVQPSTNQRMPNSALYNASSNGHLKLVKYLRQRGANLQSDCANSLWGASSNGHLEVVRYLVEYCGANVHALGKYTLYYAFKNGHKETGKYLQSKGAVLHR